MQMMTIERTQPSRSGKTLSVLSQNTWYSTKCWDLANMVGQTIAVQLSTSQYDGSTIHWIDDYQVPGQPHHASRPQAASQAPQQPIAKSSTIDRDASIVAQALCKSVQFANIEQAWQAYTTVYRNYAAWDPRQPVAEQPQQPEFNDDIPF